MSGHIKKKYSAVFLDRDGVINERIIGGYVTKPEEFVFLTGAVEGIRILSSIFEYVFIVTNQQGIARKFMTLEQLESIHALMRNTIEASGGRINGIYFCPHNVNDECSCRKPKNGMFQNAISDYPDINISSSYMIGDTMNDLLFGKASGLKTILISKEVQYDITTLRLADMQYGSLFDAAKHLEKNSVT